jgi:hypothetical protein
MQQSFNRQTFSPLLPPAEISGEIFDKVNVQRDRTTTRNLSVFICSVIVLKALCLVSYTRDMSWPIQVTITRSRGKQRLAQ